MKTKLLLPVLAMIFAIGMSFTTVSSDTDPNMDYILTESGVVPVQELNCGLGSINCEARLAPEGDAYPVYDDANLSIRKTGNGEVNELF